MPNSFSRDARTFYANTFGAGFSGLDMQLAFGIQVNPGTEDASMEVQSTVIMTHQAAKFLGILLGELVSNFEKASNTTIPVDEARIGYIRKIIAETSQPALLNLNPEKKKPSRKNSP